MTLGGFIKNIAFFGYSDFKESSKEYKQAFKAAQVLAKKGYTIVNGGGPGIMDASTQGAESVDGETLAITFNPKDAPGFEGRYVANRVDKEIKTKNYIERMFKLMEHADCYVIFNGGTGTLSEFGTAWVLARLYYPHHKPFILYGKFWKSIIKVLMEKMKIRSEAVKVFKIVESDEEMIKAILEFEEKKQ
ncbi:MAG: LOG family protein [Candidatus Beckwithbacteria bacterium]|nr:LOG family protein [Patescibacteria group bacterium]